VTTPPLILIVDDFEDALDMYRDYLTFKGFRVATAATGPDAITIAIKEKPALIFMDLRMAEMSGTEAMDALRADPDFQKVPIIAFTAHALESERRTALRAGFDELIAKPCLPDDLVGAVTRLLASNSQSKST
jgi:two-component system, cell cycle response regulator DivK